MEQEYSRSADKNNPHIEPDPSQRRHLPNSLDQETGVREVLEILENIIAEAGDLIESALSKRDCSCFITSARPQGKASMMSTRRCAMAEFVKVAKTGEIAPGEARAVEAGGKRIALFNLDGTFHAIDDTCTHRGGPLSEGMVVGTEVTCPWHGAVFDVTSGTVLGAPAPRDVAHYSVRVEGEYIEVEI